MTRLLLLIFFSMCIAQDRVEYIDQLEQEEYIPHPAYVEEAEPIQQAKAERVVSSITGKVKKESRGIPGLEVYIVHPDHGRSLPRETDSKGGFEFGDIPVFSRDSTDLFYLEVYWGRHLYYQNGFVLKPGENYFIIEL